jgi:hypothetical protein
MAAYNIGDKIKYEAKGKSCIVIATKEIPHTHKFGVKEIDGLGLIRPVPEGYDYTIVETNVDFSPYIDVLESDIKSE